MIGSNLQSITTQPRPALATLAVADSLKEGESVQLPVPQDLDAAFEMLKADCFVAGVDSLPVPSDLEGVFEKLSRGLAIPEIEPESIDPHPIAEDDPEVSIFGHKSISETGVMGIMKTAQKSHAIVSWLGGGLWLDSVPANVEFPSPRRLRYGWANGNSRPRHITSSFSRVGDRVTGIFSKLNGFGWEGSRQRRSRVRRRAVLLSIAATVTLFYALIFPHRDQVIEITTDHGELVVDLPDTHSHAAMEGHTSVTETSLGRVLYSVSSARKSDTLVNLFMLVHLQPMSEDPITPQFTDELSPAAVAVVNGLGGSVTTAIPFNDDSGSGLEFEFQGFQGGTPVFGRGRVLRANGEYVVLLFSGATETSMNHPDGMSFLQSLSYSAWG